MVNISDALTSTLSTLITANHILHHGNVLDSFGHISVRNPLRNDTFFIALQMGPAVVSGAADIGEYFVDSGEGVEGTVGGYAERYIHSAVLKRYPDVNSVVHSHSEDVLPYTVLTSNETKLSPVYHMAGFLGDDVPNWDIETAYNDSSPRDMLVNSASLGDSLAQTLGINASQPTSPAHWTILQRGHGFVTTGTSIEQATEFAMYAASNARVQTRALLLRGVVGGNVQYLSADERVNCANMNKWIAFKPWRQWVREVERDPTYDNELGTPPGA